MTIERGLHLGTVQMWRTDPEQKNMDMRRTATKQQPQLSMKINMKITMKVMFPTRLRNMCFMVFT